MLLKSGIGGDRLREITVAQAELLWGDDDYYRGKAAAADRDAQYNRFKTVRTALGLNA